MYIYIYIIYSHFFRAFLIFSSNGARTSTSCLSSVLPTHDPETLRAFVWIVQITLAVKESLAPFALYSIHYMEGVDGLLVFAEFTYAALCKTELLEKK